MPNFDEVNQAAGDKAYSKALILYGRLFVKELTAPARLILQGNPKYYDMVGAVKDLDKLTWSVNQHFKNWKGDAAYIWLLGAEGGITVSGTIQCNPEMREPTLDIPYVRIERNSKPYPAVDILLERKSLLGCSDFF